MIQTNLWITVSLPSVVLISTYGHLTSWFRYVLVYCVDCAEFYCIQD